MTIKPLGRADLNPALWLAHCASKTAKVEGPFGNELPSIHMQVDAPACVNLAGDKQVVLRQLKLAALRCGVPGDRVACSPKQSLRENIARLAQTMLEFRFETLSHTGFHPPSEIGGVSRLAAAGPSSTLTFAAASTYLHLMRKGELMQAAGFARDRAAVFSADDVDEDLRSAAQAVGIKEVARQLRTAVDSQSPALQLWSLVDAGRMTQSEYNAAILSAIADGATIDPARALFSKLSEAELAAAKGAHLAKLLDGVGSGEAGSSGDISKTLKHIVDMAPPSFAAAISGAMVDGFHAFWTKADFANAQRCSSLLAELVRDNELGRVSVQKARTVSPHSFAQDALFDALLRKFDHGAQAVSIIRDALAYLRHDVDVADPALAQHIVDRYGKHLHLPRGDKELRFFGVDVSTPLRERTASSPVAAQMVEHILASTSERVDLVNASSRIDDAAKAASGKFDKHDVALAATEIREIIEDLSGHSVHERGPTIDRPR